MSGLHVVSAGRVALFAARHSLPFVCHKASWLPLDSIYSDVWDDAPLCNPDALRFAGNPWFAQTFLVPPSISWLPTADLIPHESVCQAHLTKLISHLRNLHHDQLLPTIIVSKSAPHVILDGHHRWRASISLGIPRVPCWLVDDGVADIDPHAVLPVRRSQFANASQLARNASFQTEFYDYFKLRVYDTRSYAVLKMSDIAAAARRIALSAESDFGIKGTKHVAVPFNPRSARSAPENEVRMEFVAPKIEWGLWKSAGLAEFKTKDGFDPTKFRDFSSE